MCIRDRYKCIVPQLINGFQGILFAHLDSRILHYTLCRRDATSKKTGAIICSTDYKIIGCTQEIALLLDIPVRSLAEIAGKTTLEMVTPQIFNEKAKNQIWDKSGAVLSLNKSVFLIEGDIEESVEKKKKKKKKKKILGWKPIKQKKKKARKETIIKK
eukprot:TRINITY_DN25584_c0_g1_i4.p2 TRINITY_DN25584_c0_g1~~TRINITY_DN25584_c0_g1_i4.p2  ORF type:complete len:158 (+),score=45.79 TRINITY_DN25584_c0_g1_i4:185-658(+)